MEVWQDYCNYKKDILLKFSYSNLNMDNFDRKHNFGRTVYYWISQSTFMKGQLPNRNFVECLRLSQPKIEICTRLNVSLCPCNFNRMFLNRNKQPASSRLETFEEEEIRLFSRKTQSKRFW